MRLPTAPLARFRTDDSPANPAPSCRPAAARRRWRPAAVAARGGGSGQVMLSGDGTSVFYEGTVYDKNPEEVGPKTFVDKVAIDSGDKTASGRATTTACTSASLTVLDPDAGPVRDVAREPDRGDTGLSRRRRVAEPAHEEQGLLPGSDAAPQGALLRRAARRLPVQGDGDAAAGLPARHAAARDLLVLSERVRIAGGLRPAGSHLQQEQLSELRHARHPVLRPPRLRRRRTRLANRRTERAG